MEIRERLRPAIRAGIPVVTVEPSCRSIFRDELPNLLADDPDAQRLADQAKTLSELLIATPGWRPPRLERKAVLHAHCHHKAVLDREAEEKVLEANGLELEKPPVGCCGHAGSLSRACRMLKLARVAKSAWAIAAMHPG